MRDFRRLAAWQRSHRLAVRICELVESSDAYKHRRLLDQLEGAAISIPANIAEGWGRFTDADRARFLDYASGSTSELEALVLIGGDLHLIDRSDAEALCDELQQIRRMLASLTRRLRTEATAAVGR